MRAARRNVCVKHIILKSTLQKFFQNVQSSMRNSHKSEIFIFALSLPRLSLSLSLPPPLTPSLFPSLPLSLPPSLSPFFTPSLSPSPSLPSFSFPLPLCLPPFVTPSLSPYLSLSLLLLLLFLLPLHILSLFLFCTSSSTPSNLSTPPVGSSFPSFPYGSYTFYTPLSFYFKLFTSTFLLSRVSSHILLFHSLPTPSSPHPPAVLHPLCRVFQQGTQQARSNTRMARWKICTLSESFIIRLLDSNCEQGTKWNVSCSPHVLLLDANFKRITTLLNVQQKYLCFWLLFIVFTW